MLAYVGISGCHNESSSLTITATMWRGGWGGGGMHIGTLPSMLILQAF